MTGRVRLTGTVPVPLAPDEAFSLFTPSGERRWAPGWDPAFPASTADETEPGTVFQTAHSGPVTWIVATCDPPRAISYALVHEGDRAGLVHVVCRPVQDGSTEATVTYDLTALSDSGRTRLERFAAEYGPFLEHWRRAIAAALAP